MVFINRICIDEEREPMVVCSDGVVNDDVQRDFDIIWNDAQEVCEVL